MSFDSAWHQLFPGLLSPRLESSNNQANPDDFFGFSAPPPSIIPEIWSSDSIGSTDVTLESRELLLSSPTPESKTKLRRSPRKNHSAKSKLAREVTSKPKGSAPKNLIKPKTVPCDKKQQAQAQPQQQQQQPPPASSKTPPAPAPVHEKTYHYKPIIVRDANSVPAMFQNFPSVITTAAVATAAASHKTPTNSSSQPTIDNILLMIAPQQHANKGKRRNSSNSNPAVNKTTTATSASVKQATQIQQIGRPRSTSLPNLETPTGIKTDQQLSDYKRRKLMQHAYDQIEELVPIRFYERPSRANVLMGAVDYILHLKEEVKALEALANPPEAIANPPEAIANPEDIVTVSPLQDESIPKD